MKTIIFGLLTLLSVIASWIFGIWAGVEFIIYLVKDTIFNWWSVCLFVISVLLAIFISITGAVVEAKDDHKIMQKFKSKKRNSKWQEKIDEIQQKQNKS